MPGIKTFWRVHAQGWAVHLCQHSQLIAAGTPVIREYEMQRPVRAWLQKVDREYTHWKWVARKTWEDSVIVMNYLWCARKSSNYQTMIQVHMREVQREYRRATHSMHRGALVSHSNPRRHK